MVLALPVVCFWLAGFSVIVLLLLVPKVVGPAVMALDSGVVNIGFDAVVLVAKLAVVVSV